MIETIFDRCVYLLVFLAGQLGMTYKEINVWIFVFIWPAFTLGLMGLVILQQVRIRGLRKEVQALRESSSSKQDTT